MLTRDIVYRLCVKNQWFTGGSNESYEKMFQLVGGNYGVEKIAIAIWVCSSNATLAEITSALYEATRRE